MDFFLFAARERTWEAQPFSKLIDTPDGKIWTLRWESPVGRMFQWFRKEADLYFGGMQGAKTVLDDRKGNKLVHPFFGFLKPVVKIVGRTRRSSTVLPRYGAESKGRSRSAIWGDFVNSFP